MVLVEAKRKSERNSNIEVLRLVAMGLIVLNHLQWGEMHYIDTNWSYIHRMGISQIVTFLSNWGGVGDCLFFGISAWFLCTERQSIRKNSRTLLAIRKTVVVLVHPYLWLIYRCSICARAGRCGIGGILECKGVVAVLDESMVVSD